MYISPLVLGCVIYIQAAFRHMYRVYLVKTELCSSVFPDMDYKDLFLEELEKEC